MQSKRDYLVGLGLAKPGRGKFSNAAKEALAKAEAAGTKFSDATVIQTKNPAGGQTAPETEVKASAPGDSAYVLPDDYRFPEKEYRAFTRDGGKKVEVSLRECCNDCRVSLVNHACNAPVIHGNIAVVIERR
jgi:hypothetical protein